MPALSLALIAIALFVYAARAGLLTSDDTELRARYALPASEFLELDGQSLHLVDQGSGVPVILIHGSFGSLLNWNDWAQALTADYRVIRFDLPRMGLSGPSADGRYGPEKTMQIIQALSRELQLEPFFLVATSSGGEAAAAYAAEYPEQVKGLVLSNIAVGPVGMDSSHWSVLFKFLIRIDPLFKGWHPQQFWKEIMGNNFADAGRVTKAQVVEWTHLNNRAQRMPPRVFSADDPRPFVRTPADLARIRSPTLLLWSANDSELPVETVGRAALEFLTVADKQLKVVADCGHMILLECGQQSVQAARPFFERITAQ